MREHSILRSGPTVEPVALSEAKVHLRVEFPEDDDLIVDLIVAAREDAEVITRRALIGQRWTYALDAFPRPGLNVGSANWYGPQWGINPGPMTVLSPDGFTGYEIFVPLPPTIAIEALTYLDVDGVLQTLDPSLYRLDLCEPAQITPAYGTVWPQTYDVKAAVKIDFIAGYAAPFTADATADTIAAPLWPAAAVGDIIRLSTAGGALPAPLAPRIDYYVQSVVSPGVYKLAATAGGAAIDITNAGSGHGLIGVVPGKIRRWMKIRIGTTYENREEVAILSRGKVELLPYVDGLLDGYRIIGF